MTNFRSNNQLVDRSDIHTVGHRVIGSAVSLVPFLTSTRFDLVVDRIEQVVDHARRIISSGSAIAEVVAEVTGTVCAKDVELMHALPVVIPVL